MKIPSRFMCVLVAGLLVSTQASSTDLGEILRQISDYAGEMCEEVEASGKITRVEVAGKLEANSGKLLDIALGPKLAGEATVSQKDEIFNNLSLDDLPDQMTSVRVCQTAIADNIDLMAIISMQDEARAKKK